MKAVRVTLSWRLGLIVAIACVACGRVVRAEDRPTPDSSLDGIQFKAPPGWQASNPPGQTARVFTLFEADAARQVFIVIAMGAPEERLDFRAGFEFAMKQMTQAGGGLACAGRYWG